MNAAIVIGCSQYDDPEIAGLKYSGKDAQAFYKVLTSHCDCSGTLSKVLTSDHDKSKFWPTRSNIIREFTKFTSDSKATHNINALFFYFSGHGFKSSLSGEDYLVPLDCVTGALEETCISFNTLFSYLRAWNTKHVILFLDACRAVLEGGKSITIEHWQHVDVRRLCPEGMATFCSCSPGERSYESDELQSGIFSFALCKAIGDEGKCKTITELDAYLVKRVPLISQEYQKPKQNPYTQVEPLSVKDFVLVSDKKLHEWQLQTPIGREIRRHDASTGARLPVTYEAQRTFFALDFGTTYSAISLLDNEGKARFVPSQREKILVPSVVSFFTNLDYVVGWDAVEAALLQPKNTIFNVKRYLGSNHFFNIEGRSISAENIASLIIKSLKRNAETHLGRNLGEALVSLPANFTITQANALARSCELAGVKIYRLIGEPCAAALLLNECIDLSRSRDARIAVLDLGGGTFDVSILEIGDGVFEAKSIVGSNRIGGLDYDKIVYEYAKSEVESLLSSQNRSLSDVDNIRLMLEATRAKIALTSRHETSIILPNVEVDQDGLRDIQIQIDRAKFRQLTRDINVEVERCIRRALHLAHVKANELDIVLLAGQGLKIFTVTEIIEKLFLTIPIVTQFQEAAVSRGLCQYTGVLSGSLTDLLLLDANYTGIGVKCMTHVSQKKGDLDFEISAKAEQNNHTFALLPLNTTCPTFKYYRAAIRGAVDKIVTLSLTEFSTFPGEPDSPIAKIDVPAACDHVLEFQIEADANRTLVLFVKVPETKEILTYQLNNHFAAPIAVSLLGHSPFPSMQTDGYEVRPVKPISA